MNTYRKTAITVGILFIVGTVPVSWAVSLAISISAPDYLNQLAAIQTRSSSQLSWSLCCGDAGARHDAGRAVPILKKYNGVLALGSVGFRGVEAMYSFSSGSACCPIVTVSEEFIEALAQQMHLISNTGTSVLGAA